MNKKGKFIFYILIIGISIGLVLLLSSCDKDNNEDESKISTIIVGELRVQLLSETIVRVEEKGPKGFEDRPSYIVVNRDDYEHVDYQVEESNTETIIKTKKYSVCIPSDGLAEDVFITSPEGEKLWAYSDAGETDTNVYLPSPSDELDSWYFTDNPRIIPSEHGYSFNKDAGKLQEWDFDNQAKDIFVFLPGGDYKQFCSDYIKVTGPSEMANLQTLGYWDSRWYAYSAETALQQIKDYRDRGYSIDVLVIDTDWRTSSSLNGGVGYQINTQLFPDMAKFLEDCENLGVDICFNDHPNPFVGSTNALDRTEVKYREDNLTLILSLGLDYWWYDRNWNVSLNSVDPDVSAYAFGMYAYQWVTAEYRDSITDLNEFAERSLIMANVDGVLHGKWYYASDLSAHRYSIQWTGDIGADSTDLAQEIYTSIFGGAEVGLPYMSSDIGGHNETVTDSMYARWMQYGALSTICRVHCTNEKYIHQDGRMPWLFGETAEEVAHTYLDMRYRLLPLYYCLARENYDTGLPIMRRLDIEYPEYVESSRNDEYLLGDYILVAPINEGLINNKVSDSALYHIENDEIKPGLIASYYNNLNCDGEPQFTSIDSNIYHDWGSASPNGLNKDNFSVKWTGNIQIGDKDAALSFYADDAIEVYIDGVKVIDGLDVYDTTLITPVYKANSTHTIEVKYAEKSDKAHIYMYYVEQVDNTRTVFIPDGTWIDVWSGERFVGPATYTVNHPIETSPIFVREGSMVALVPNMQSTSEKDWSEMTLDVYPSANYDANITLYEDDTKTIAYKTGHYRTTDISMEYDKDKESLLINIGAAKGKFDGNLAFLDRTWKVRVHTNPGWGSVTSIKVNNQETEYNLIAKSKDGKPFAFEGASLDSDVYEFKVEGSVYEEYIIEISYSKSVDSNENSSYEKIEIPFELVVEDIKEEVYFEDSLSWISYGEHNDEKYISNETLNLFSPATSYDKPWFDSGSFKKILPDGSISTKYLVSQKDFSFEIDTKSDVKYYELYLGGYQSTAKVTVRDTAGNVKTINFGNINGSYMKKVVIETPSDVEGKLYVTYSMVASEYTKKIYDNNRYDVVCYLTLIGATANDESFE